MDNVSFRFSQRIGNETTAHETGIFYFTSRNSTGKLIGEDKKTSITFRREPSFNLSALTDASLQLKTQESSVAIRLKTKNMLRGAGNDTKQISLIAPVGMIFVPSVGGIIHSPNEFTKVENMENGANVLLHTHCPWISKRSQRDRTFQYLCAMA